MFVNQDSLKTILSIHLNENKEALYYDKAKHSLYNELNIPFLKLPVSWYDIPDILTYKNWKDIKICSNYLVAIITTGQSVLGKVENNALIKHKVIRKYMVRKKQGVSQLKYLKTKGKSRLGSRIRLRNSILFFEEINKVIYSWYDGSLCRILFFIPKNLINMWFFSGVKLPFDRKDNRLIRLPYNNIRPNYEYLKRVLNYAQQGYYYKDT